MKKEEVYSINGLDYKLIEEDDGWWSIYCYHIHRMEYVPVIQAKTLEKAKEYCDMREPITVPLKELV